MSWKLLGLWMHGILPRMWSVVLSSPDLQCEQEDEEIGDEMQDLGGQPSEEGLRRIRARRAGRIKAWIDSNVCQLWSAVCFFATQPLATLLGAYLQDEQIYHADPEAPWTSWPNSRRDRPTPTLHHFAESHFRTLRLVQAQLRMLLEDSGDRATARSFLLRAFPRRSFSRKSHFPASQSIQSLRAYRQAYSVVGCSFWWVGWLVGWWWWW